MADESTVRDLIHKAQDGEDLTPDEVERVTTWMRDDFGPAVRQASEALSNGFRVAFQQLGDYIASPQGQQLVAIARTHERRRA